MIQVPGGVVPPWRGLVSNAICIADTTSTGRHCDRDGSPDVEANRSRPAEMFGTAITVDVQRDGTILTDVGETTVLTRQRIAGWGRHGEASV